MRGVAKSNSVQLSELFVLTADKMKLSPAIIEKDFWVCWMLDYLFFHSPDGTEVWCAYHGMNKSNPRHEPETRYCHIQKVNFSKDGFPVMGTAIGASK